MSAHNSESSDEQSGSSRGRSSLAFWNRPDIERARRLVDLWASCKRARIAGVDGCPTVDAVFERPAPRSEPWLDKRTGLWMTDEEILVRTSTMKPLPEPRLAELAIDKLLEELGSPRLAVSLLFNLYPRSGPYEQEGDIGGFRPRTLFGGLRGKYLDRARTALLGQLHRETLVQIARQGATSEESSQSAEAA